MTMARIDQTSNSLAVDTDVLFVNVTNNRVGINQGNPSVPLHVVGATTIDSGDLVLSTGNLTITAGSGTIAGQAIIKAGDPVSLLTNDSGYIDGTLGAGQVAYATGANAVAGSNNLFWDNNNVRLGIGTSSPAVALHIQENSLDEILRIESTDATPGSNSAPDVIIKSAKQTTNDYLGSLWWYANDDGGATEAYGRIGMILDDPTNNAESGAMFIQSDVEGTLRTMLYLEGYTTGGTGQVVANYKR